MNSLMSFNICAHVTTTTTPVETQNATVQSSACPIRAVYPRLQATTRSLEDVDLHIFFFI